MSKQRQRIKRALAAKGYTPTNIRWEPISAGAEKAGPGGGWFVTFGPPAPVPGIVGGEYIAVGLNIEEVLDDIARLPDAGEDS